MELKPNRVCVWERKKIFEGRRIVVVKISLTRHTHTHTPREDCFLSSSLRCCFILLVRRLLILCQLTSYEAVFFYIFFVCDQICILLSFFLLFRAFGKTIAVVSFCRIMWQRKRTECESLVTSISWHCKDLLRRHFQYIKRCFLCCSVLLFFLDILFLSPKMRFLFWFFLSFRIARRV